MLQQQFNKQLFFIKEIFAAIPVYWTSSEFAPTIGAVIPQRTAYKVFIATKYMVPKTQIFCGVLFIKIIITL